MNFEIVLIVLVWLWYGFLSVMCGIMLIVYTFSYNEQVHNIESIKALLKGTKLKEYADFKSDVIVKLLYSIGKSIALGIVWTLVIKVVFKILNS